MCWVALELIAELVLHNPYMALFRSLGSPLWLWLFHLSRVPFCHGFASELGRPVLWGLHRGAGQPYSQQL